MVKFIILLFNLDGRIRERGPCASKGNLVCLHVKKYQKINKRIGTIYAVKCFTNLFYETNVVW
jgi:hypothetical protein